MTGPLIVAQITDPHLRFDAPARTVQLKATVDALLAMELRLAAVLLTGDVADNGRSDESLAAAAEFLRFDAPVVVIPGNHDDRANLRAAFNLPGAPSDPIRSIVHVPGEPAHEPAEPGQSAGVRIIAGDTTIAGQDSGSVDVAWIADQLAADLATPTLIALHHVPAPIGSPGIDELGIPAADRNALAEVLAAAPNVLAVLAGHVHRATLGRLGGVPVITAPSSNAQLAFSLTGALEATDAEPPALMLHVITPEGLVSHVVPVRRA